MPRTSHTDLFTNGANACLTDFRSRVCQCFRGYHCLLRWDDKSYDNQQDVRRVLDRYIFRVSVRSTVLSSVSVRWQSARSGETTVLGVKWNDLWTLSAQARPASARSHLPTNSPTWPRACFLSLQTLGAQFTFSYSPPLSPLPLSAPSPERI